jgi:IMP dehydrogenase
VPWSEKVGPDTLTYDDVLLVPRMSHVHPRDVDVRSRFSRRIPLNIPIVSAAMDSVTESELAVALAREGGLGVIHKNLAIAEQCAQVDRVKRSESGMIVDPVTLGPDATLEQAHAIMARFHISGVPITEGGRLVGILTNRDLRFEDDTSRAVSELMTSESLVTVPVGTTLEEARAVLHRHKVEKLPVVDDDGRLKGLITVKDIQKRIQYPHATKDGQGRLRVGAAVGTGAEGLQRAEALATEDVDVLVVDTSHGHSQGVVEIVRELKGRYDIPVIAGNVATPEATEALIDAGADAVKVGMGPGAICTTRVVAGIGVPQVTAVYDCAQVAARHDVPLIADGGINFSGDIAKAVAAGADSVMVGGLLAGVDESPGEVVFHQGEQFKEYRGMGSLGAMRERYSSDRYFQADVDEIAKLVPEGIEGRVAYKGPLRNVVHQLVGGLRQAMGYCGAASIEELKQARFVRVTAAGMRESHPHDIAITKEAPNYRPGS